MPKGETGERPDNKASGHAPATGDVNSNLDLSADGTGPSAVEPAMVDRGMQAQLGQQLRALFDHVAGEPVPERLLKLLEELESKEKKR